MKKGILIQQYVKSCSYKLSGTSILREAEKSRDEDSQHQRMLECTGILIWVCFLLLCMWGWAVIPKVPLCTQSPTQTCREQCFHLHLGKPRHRQFSPFLFLFPAGKDWLFLLKNIHTFALFIHTQIFTDLSKTLKSVK